MSILFAWLGDTDLRASAQHDADGYGPIAGATAARHPKRAVVLSAQRAKPTQHYKKWFQDKFTGTELVVHQTTITDPWDFARIYHESLTAVERELTAAHDRRPMVFHLSPGTGAMSAAWIILAKIRFAAELIQSSQREGPGKYPIRTVNLPFELSVELIGDLLRKPGEDLARLTQSLPPANAEFGRFLYKSRMMEELVVKARRVALFANVPVLILGESGTGKELLARAIHAASPGASKPFKAINCGAIPPTLLESELFGHVKGAFSGASRDKPGLFEIADGGTVFLDEVGELPLPAQVSLLRTLQEKVVVRVGGHREQPVNVRIIAATNRDLFAGLDSGSFRLDLLHRLAVAILKVPPLRARPEDIDLLADHFMETFGPELARALPSGATKLTRSARRCLREHDWPGNVRDLQNTLIRAMVWTPGEKLTAEDISNAFLVLGQKASLYDRPLGNGFSLPELLETMRAQYIKRALRMANGNQTRAASLLGLTRQTFANWARGDGLRFGESEE